MNKTINVLKKYKIYILLAVIAILFEVFICNYTSFRILTADKRNIEVEFQKEDIFYSNEVAKSPPTNKDFEVTDKTISFKEFEDNIYSIKLISNNATEDSYITINIVSNEKPYTSDEININRQIATKTVKFINSEANINLNIDKNISEKVYVNIFSYGSDIEIDKIILNSFNFGFSFIRLILIYLLIIFIYLFKTKKIYKMNYDKNDKKYKRIYIYVVIFTTLLVFSYCVLEHFCYPEKVIIDENDTEETMILQADAVLKGSIPLLKEAGEDITGLDNPYDISARYFYDTDYLFDSAYYDGDFYQYFSILPVIFFIIPLKLITGCYISTRIVNSFLFSILLILLSILYKVLIDKYIKKVSMFNFLLGYFTIVFGSNVLNYVRGLMYDIPVVFGIASLIAAILIFFDLEKKEKFKYFKLIFAGIFTGFVVMSKPSLIGYYIIIFCMLYAYLIKFKNDKKGLIKRFLAFFIPLGILGIIQMWFNYIRFDSIFEFGALYQLTVADMNVHTGVSLPILAKGIFKFLFTLPKIEAFKFPFINTYDNFYYNMGLNEYEYENCVAGILIIPIIWGIFLKKKIPTNTSSGKKLITLSNITIITSIVLLVVVVCFAGAAEAYSIDIKLMLVITAVLIFLKIIEGLEVKDKNASNRYNYIYFILCIISIVLVLPQSFSTEGSLLENMYMPINMILENIFEFWT